MSGQRGRPDQDAQRSELPTVLPPMFSVEKVDMTFPVSTDYVAAQVASDILVLALSNRRLLRIDLKHAGDVEDIELPKKGADLGVIRKLFLDPTASHLLIATATGENFYLHAQSRSPRLLSRLRGVHVECIAWSPARPTSSTREILLGARDGTIYETFIESSTDFYRRDEKYSKLVYRRPDSSITGIHISPTSDGSSAQHVFVATTADLVRFDLPRKKGAVDGSGPIYASLAEIRPVEYTSGSPSSSARAHFSITPALADQPNRTARGDSYIVWMADERLFQCPSDPGLSTAQISQNETTLQLASILGASKRKPRDESRVDVLSAILSGWHLLMLIGTRLVVMDILSHKKVLDQEIVAPADRALSLVVDVSTNTYWLFTSGEIFEIVVTEEDRDVWRFMLDRGDYKRALDHATTSTQRESVEDAQGQVLLKQGKFFEAAIALGKSSARFEETCVKFLEAKEHRALRQYLFQRLATMSKQLVMQRTMVATWLIELYMAALNQAESGSQLGQQSKPRSDVAPADGDGDIDSVRNEYANFVRRFHPDLDRSATYEIIHKHGRDRELVFYAELINDHVFLLHHWSQRERRDDILHVLGKQKDPEVFYRYSTALMQHVATQFVDLLIRQTNLEPQLLVPSLLEYNEINKGPLVQNQAARYLQHLIHQQGSKNVMIHNTFLAILAQRSEADELQLLNYLESFSNKDRAYDADFALRLCIQHGRTQSCVFLYKSMGNYEAAVELALEHKDDELAIQIVDQSEGGPSLRKKLWLAIAKKTVSSSRDISIAVSLLKRSDNLLRIEDLIPFFPDFVTIDAFKEPICAALDEYSRQIDSLRREMNDSEKTSLNIQEELKMLDERYVMIGPSEKCFICRLPLLARQFFVFPCQHSFHTDCLTTHVLRGAGLGKSRKIKELQARVIRSASTGKARDQLVRSLDDLVAESCVLCNATAVDKIDDPFVSEADKQEEWAI